MVVKWLILGTCFFSFVGGDESDAPVYRYGPSITCTANQCQPSVLTCDDNSDCTITCDGDNACQEADIYCPSNAHCDILCLGGSDACKEIRVFATDALSLSITCEDNHEDEFEQCDEFRGIYCPDNGRGGPPMCSITGVGEYSVPSFMHIYAVEGLNDVTVSGASNVDNIIVHCKADYSDSCVLRYTADYDECFSGDVSCASYLLPSQPPTRGPTQHPTRDPSVSPSLSPSENPTANPTYNPTCDPPPYAWNGYDGKTCGGCSALVNGFDKVGDASCQAFCSKQGLRCVDAWDDKGEQ